MIELMLEGSDICRGLRILCLYRFKLWWMTQWLGTRGQDIPCETQFLLVEVPQFVEEPSNSVYYAVFLPILEGGFRAVLQGNAHDELEICLESGTYILAIFFANVHSCRIGI